MKIMVLEDQRIILQGIVKMIQHCMPEARVYPYSAAKSALREIDELHPDILFTDIIMEDMNGLDFIRAVREKKLRGDIVIISGYANFGYAQEAINLGVKAYLLKPVKRTEIQAILQENAQKLSSKTETVYTGLINRAIALIDELCESELSVALLAEKLHVAPNYLSNMFSKETGSSLSEWIRKTQMQRAAMWLRTTDMFLYEIADRLGYHDVKYFSRIFRHYYDDTPLHYRKAKREEVQEDDGDFT